jgi:transcriptional regulator
MYRPKYHLPADHEASLSLIEAHPLGAWVCHTDAGLVANHVPFFLDRSRGLHGTLLGHVSRANGVWRALTSATPSVVMFQGPQAYITPGWYPGKHEHGQVVPTWNYAVAHAHGVVRVMDDRDCLLDMLNRLTNAQEAGQVAPWRVADAPAHFIDGLLRGIVGIELPIDRLEGKFKVSQDEAMPDRLGTVRGLQAQAGEGAQAMAELVKLAIEAASALPHQPPV